MLFQVRLLSLFLGVISFLCLPICPQWLFLPEFQHILFYKKFCKSYQNQLETVHYLLFRKCMVFRVLGYKDQFFKIILYKSIPKLVIITSFFNNLTELLNPSIVMFNIVGNTVLLHKKSNMALPSTLVVLINLLQLFQILQRKKRINPFVPSANFLYL